MNKRSITRRSFTYFYVFLWVFVLPVIIGGSVGDRLLEVYQNFNKHWLAGLVVCLISGAVVTWVPMGFMIEKIDFWEKRELLALTLLGWIIGILAPLVFGFQQLGLIITVLLIFSSIITVTKISEPLKRSRNQNSQV